MCSTLCIALLLYISHVHCLKGFYVFWPIRPLKWPRVNGLSKQFDLLRQIFTTVVFKRCGSISINNISLNPFPTLSHPQLLGAFVIQGRARDFFATWSTYYFCAWSARKDWVQLTSGALREGAIAWPIIPQCKTLTSSCIACMSYIINTISPYNSCSYC